MAQIIKERYELVKQLQSGGFGTTWLAIDRMLDIQVAVKEYHSTDPSSQKTFFREARKLAKYSNEPGVVNVRDYIEEDGRAYLVMEYLEGEDLGTKVEQAGTISFEAAWMLMKPLIETVQRMHEDGLIHRDISPDNIRLLPNGMLKLLDFGSALDLGQDMNKTMTMTVKPGYAPYEQYMARELQGTWTDVYAVCAVLYKCITGITPPDSLQRGFHDELKTPRAAGAAIRQREERILLKGLAVKPDDRIQTLGDLIREMETRPEKAQSSVKTPSVQKETIREPEKVHTERVRTEKVQPEKPRSKKPQSEKPQPERAQQVKARSEKAVKHSGRNKKPIIALAAVAVLLVAGSAVVLNNQDGMTIDSTESSYQFKNQTVSASEIAKVGKKQNIKYLNFYGCELDEEAVKAISDMKYVENLYMTDCTGFESLASLEEMENLKTLDYTNYSYSEEILTDTDQMFSGEFTNLEKVSLRLKCAQGDGKFLEHFPNATQLVLNTEGLENLQSLSKVSNLSWLRLGDKIDLSGDMAEALSECKNLRVLHAEDTGLASLEFVNTLENLEELDIADCQVTDLTPLQHSEKLSTLDIANNQVVSLEPLSECINMIDLRASGNQIDSVEALAGMTKLRDLYLNNNRVSDLSPLKNAAMLSTLEINGNELTSLQGLEGAAENLSWLAAKKNQISDISSLAGCKKMRYLWLSDNQITDLDVCEQMIELTSMAADKNQITSAAGLVNSTQIKTLNLAKNQISDLSFMENYTDKLEMLNITENQVSSLKPLAGCSSLKTLLAGKNQLTSLEGLEDKTSLYAVMADHNQISDLTPISNSAAVLLYADFGNNQLTDVSALSKLTGRKLAVFLENNQISDISMLPTERNYIHLSVYGNQIQDVSVIGAFKNIAFIYDRLFIGYSKDVDYSAVITSAYGKGYEFYVVDCPLSDQGKFLQQVKDAHWGGPDPKFITADEADENLNSYRSELMKQLLNEEDEETSEDETAEETSAEASDSTEISSEAAETEV
ncbi:MAG: leucine-rich repeat domain-containing protein [Eubacteriales bacterium]|nr:leucine-rich repeat domain-containing protein [Eubacteriales bacterium]